MTEQKTVGLVLYPLGLAPNTSNRLLVAKVRYFIMSHPDIHCLIYTLDTMGVLFHNEGLEQFTTYFPQSELKEELSILRFARWVAQETRSNVDNIIVFTATPYRQRAFRDTVKAFWEAVITIPIELATFMHPDFLRDNNLFYNAVGGDDSIYWFACFNPDERKRLRWRERWYRILPWSIYRIVAK